jgi:primosomal protein N' (replication factor Y)
MCENCSVALVYHHSRKKLLCHHCDYATDVPGICPHCRAGIFGERGFGTEQVVKEVETSFPRARIQRMDLDTTRRKGAHVDILSRFQKGEIDILVGTQMITKGLDIPNVTLVGIINADVALTIPDFRAGERTFGLLTQVAGRAGRGGTRGEVFIQTYCPDNYAVRFALSQDYLGFVEQEFRYRKQILFPPFSRIVNIRIESKTEDVAMEESRNLGRTLRDLVHSDAEMKEVRILGPAPCPFLKLRNWFRYQVTLQSASYQSIARLLGSQPVSEFVDKSHNLFKVVVDVDPISML